MSEVLLRYPEVKGRTGGIAKSTLYNLMARGQFPLPVKLGDRAVAWKQSEIDAWIESRQTAQIRGV